VPNDKRPRILSVNARSCRPMPSLPACGAHLWLFLLVSGPRLVTFRVRRMNPPVSFLSCVTNMSFFSPLPPFFILVTTVPCFCITFQVVLVSLSADSLPMPHFGSRLSFFGSFLGSSVSLDPIHTLPFFSRNPGSTLSELPFFLVSSLLSASPLHRSGCLPTFGSG